MTEHRQQQLLHLQKPREEDLPTEEAIDNAYSFDPLKKPRKDASYTTGSLLKIEKLYLQLVLA